jgi:hypothetical protein
MSAQALPEGLYFVIAQDGDGMTLCGRHGPFVVTWDWDTAANYPASSLIWGPEALGTMNASEPRTRRR